MLAVANFREFDLVTSLEGSILLDTVKRACTGASSNLYLKPAISPRGDVMVGDDGAPAVRYARSIRAAATEEKEVPASPGQTPLYKKGERR